MKGKDIFMTSGTIKASEFVKRQTPNSPFAHFSGSWEQIEKMVDARREWAVQGYKPGVFLTEIPAEGFFSSVTKLNEQSMIFATFKPRREGEESYLGTLAIGSKVPAKKVVIVTYSKEVLAEGNERSTDADYEIVSINASPFADRETPMDPVTMMRNYLERPGGTKGDFSALQFAESILFWSQHAMVAESK